MIEKNKLALLGPSEAKDITGMINQVVKVDRHEKQLLYDPFEFLDDVTGQTLDKTMAVEARKLEMLFFRSRKVYDKVPKWMAARDGCKVFTTKWRDINNSTSGNQTTESIKTDSRQELFAARSPSRTSSRLMTARMRDST